MARSIWNGAVAFGAVTVPVKVFGAVEDRTIHFSELHVRDDGPVGHRMINDEGEHVVDGRVVKGYEIEPDRHVVVEPDEIKAAWTPPRKAIELEAFVPADQIDAVGYDRPYHLGPGANAEGAYRLLVRTLERTGRVGIGRVTLRRPKEQVVAVGAANGVLRMQVLRYADELVPAADLDAPEPARAPSDREVDMAAALVESLAAPFDPASFTDTYRERVLELIRRKAAGEEAPAPAPAAPPAYDDLVAALEASLAASGRG